MSKRFKHWCDNKHNKPDTKFTIEELAKDIQVTVEKYLEVDVPKNTDSYNRDYIHDKMLSMNHSAEMIKLLVVDANSQHPYTEQDFNDRYSKWKGARGYCFRLNAQLNRVVEVLYQTKNIRKYTRLAGEVNELSNRIKQNIILDNERRSKLNL